MKNSLSRRDFLNILSTLPLVPLLKAAPLKELNRPATNQTLPNIILILFDALSAFNLSLYGYPRKTCPNLERLAQRANVYHGHHSAANFTTPSTASLFTGCNPWTHRAFGLSSLISAKVAPNNLFRLLGETYHQVAFSQNIYADMLLYQCGRDLDEHLALDSYSYVSSAIYPKFFKRDAIFGLKSFDEFLFRREEAHGSLFLSILSDISLLLSLQKRAEKFKDVYPQGLPRLANTDVYFSLNQVMEGVMELLNELPTPSFIYLHFMPPHAPYTPSKQFLGMFEDGWSPPTKKRHPLAPKTPAERIDAQRRRYDEYIANLDAEFGRLLDFMEKAHWLENSYIFVTSDHGEMFERGVIGHSTPLLFEPVIRIPLIISSPGQTKRQDIYTITSNVDLLPTLLTIAGHPIPAWCEGRVLPGFGGNGDAERSIFIIEAKKNPSFTQLDKTTIALIKGKYKLVYYLGYRNYDHQYEFYDLENDPDEIEDLYPSHPLAGELQEELMKALREKSLP